MFRERVCASHAVTAVTRSYQRGGAPLACYSSFLREDGRSHVSILYCKHNTIQIMLEVVVIYSSGVKSLPASSLIAAAREVPLGFGRNVNDEGIG